MKFLYFFYFTLCCVLVFEGVFCEKDGLDDDTKVWGDEVDSTTEELAIDDKSSIEIIERSLDLKGSGEKNSKGKDQSKDTLNNMDLGKFFKAANEHVNMNLSTVDVSQSKYIQRVAKKLNINDGPNSNKLINLSATEYSNISDSDVRWLTRIFSIVSWNAEMIPGSKNISNVCKTHMKQYLRALENGTIWADKMSDSSGRYTSQFFFGNDFWLGSKTECQEIQNKLYNHQLPPFPIHFFVSKFILQLHGKTRLLSIGLCLPRDCSAEDIKTMLEGDAAVLISQKPKRSLIILSTRAVPGPYSIMADKKLHFLLTVLVIVMLLSIIGTCYEISLQRKKDRWYKMPEGNNNNNNNNAADMKIIAPLETLPSMELKMENGFHMTKNNDSPVVQISYRKNESILGQLILSFSAISNSRKILHVGSTPEESLTCIHGLRFFSLLWVIMVHTYLQVFTIAENKELRVLAERNFMFQTVSNATFSVDTFFFISGLLVAYLYFKSPSRENTDQRRRLTNGGCLYGFKKFFKLVGYRYLRLTPAYMFVLLIAEISMRWIHNNSVFEPQSQNHVSCDKYWWRNILYINSLYPMKDMCMLWSWYVSNDTQFYLLGILILLFSFRYFKFSVAMLLFLLFTSWGVTITVSLYYDYRAKIEDPFLLFDELYDKPWTRLGPYLIGILAGWFIYKSKCKLNISKSTVIVAWFLSIFTLLSLVYGLHLCPLGAIGSSLYVSIGHTAWGVALAWIVIACCSGHGGYIDSFLSFKLLHPLSRLTYCAYLVHPIIMTTTNFQMNAPLHLQDSIVVILYFGNTLASFLASFCISLLFEAPVVRLLKMMVGDSPRRKTNAQTNL